MLRTNSINFSLLFSIVFILFSTNILAQKNQEVWDNLLANKRENASELSKKLNVKNDIESLYLKKLIDIENGKLSTDFDFLKDFTDSQDHEYYLFAGWETPVFFGDYLSSGFSQTTVKVPGYFEPENIDNTTIKSGVNYLIGISNRFERDWDGYKEYLDRINSIRTWEYCGVFENLNSSGLQMPYPPETETSKDVEFDAQSNGFVSWYKPKDPDEAYNFFSNQIEFGGGVHYAQTFINSEKDQRVLLHLGKGGLVKLWLNDVVITENDEAYITELDAYTYAVNLKQGVNRILVKSAVYSGTPYFILRFEDLERNPLNNIKVSFENRNYFQGDEKSVDPEFIEHSVEQYFKEKSKEENSDKLLSEYLLFKTYIRNGKIDDATEIMKKWYEEYPESSFVQNNLMTCYQKKGDENEEKKLKNKLMQNDPQYYVSQLLEYTEMDKLMKEDLDTFEEKITEIGQATDYDYLNNTSELFILFRKQDRSAIKKSLNRLIETEDFPSKIRPTFIDFYSKIFNDDKKTIETLEDFHKDEFNYKVINYLSYYYKKQNKIDKALDLYKTTLEHFPDDNNILLSIINILHDTDRFKESLPYIDRALENYPDSFLFTKLKGDALVQIGDKSEGVEYYKSALERKSSNYDLRTKINDLENKKNPLKEFHKDELYDYISNNRNKIEENNYGVNGLLMQTDILNYKTGGGEYRVTEIYEITSQNGIDIFKEYDLDLGGDYVIKKSEAIKPNGDILPADKSGSNLVFDNLEVGDVIYIDYESRFSRYGRFYNEYIYNNNFGGYHPFINEIYRVLTSDKEVNYTITNGEVEYKTFKKGEYYVHEWSINDYKAIPVTEDYMPSFEDVVPRLHVSSIESWDEVANWYSDLVRKQLKEDKTIEDTFDSIFPDGYAQFSENERAKKIYDYVTGDFNYSFVNFRQSGFVPQKPSKTIKTKLGDCKDFSSLYLVLAKKAELDANIVLILTADYGEDVLILPSTDFNHAIVKVMIDGETQYLELTDKHLPYKSIPLSLRGAKALIIPYQNNSQGAELLTLNDVNKKQAVMKSECVIELDEDTSKIRLSTEASAHLASYYVELFESYTDKTLEDEIQGEIANRTTVQVELKDIENHNYDNDKGTFSYEADLTSDIKINKIGDLLTVSIPYFLNPYTYSVIQAEDRSFPIEYKQYENADAYEETIKLKLSDKYEFKDIPSDKTFNFKDHVYKVSFKKLKPNELEVNVYSEMNLKNIMPEEYLEFKSYVEEVLDTKEVLVSFKPV